MLNMGFVDDIKDILKKCPEERQTFLFSATFPTQVKSLAQTFMKQPKEVKIKAMELTVPLIEQRYYEVNPRQKVETLCRVLDVEHPPVCIIFCRTKRGVDELVAALEVRGYAAEALHGDLSQRERDVVINRFRHAKTEILVATDVAARGLDITHVTHVFNYDIPQDPDSYVHRIGRTGRAGRQGIAITLVEPREVKQLRFIERLIKKQITRHILPSFEDAIKKRQQVLAEKLVGTLEEPLGDYLDIANELLQEYDSTKLVAAALKQFANQGRQIETSDIKGVRTSKTQVKIPVGRNAGVRPKSLVSLIADNTSLRPKQIGDIEIFQNYTLIEVPEEFVEAVTQATLSLGKGVRETSRKKTLPPGVKPTGGRPAARAGSSRAPEKRTRKRPE
jgi:ATP-dependent RNA helicase DeaD